MTPKFTDILPFRKTRLARAETLNSHQATVASLKKRLQYKTIDDRKYNDGTLSKIEVDSTVNTLEKDILIMDKNSTPHSENIFVFDGLVNNSPIVDECEQKIIEFGNDNSNKLDKIFIRQLTEPLQRVNKDKSLVTIERFVPDLIPDSIIISGENISGSEMPTPISISAGITPTPANVAMDSPPSSKYLHKPHLISSNISLKSPKMRSSMTPIITRHQRQTKNEAPIVSIVFTPRKIKKLKKYKRKRHDLSRSSSAQMYAPTEQLKDQLTPRKTSTPAVCSSTKDVFQYLPKKKSKFGLKLLMKKMADVLTPSSSMVGKTTTKINHFPKMDYYDSDNSQKLEMVLDEDEYESEMMDEFDIELENSQEEYFETNKFPHVRLTDVEHTDGILLEFGDSYRKKNVGVHRMPSIMDDEDEDMVFIRSELRENRKSFENEVIFEIDDDIAPLPIKSGSKKVPHHEMITNSSDTVIVIEDDVINARYSEENEDFDDAKESLEVSMDMGPIHHSRTATMESMTPIPFSRRRQDSQLSDFFGSAQVSRDRSGFKGNVHLKPTALKRSHSDPDIKLMNI